MITRRALLFGFGTAAVLSPEKLLTQPNPNQSANLGPGKRRIPEQPRSVLIRRPPVPINISGMAWFPIAERAVQKQAAYRFLGKSTGAEAVKILKETPTYYVAGRNPLASTDFRHVFLSEGLLMATDEEVRRFAAFFEFKPKVDAHRLMIACAYLHEILHVTSPSRFPPDGNCARNLTNTLIALEVFFPEYMMEGAAKRVKEKIGHGALCTKMP
jgi:hypothetical protein